jgi:hypothetical protein
LGRGHAANSDQGRSEYGDLLHKSLLCSGTATCGTDTLENDARMLTPRCLQLSGNRQ